MTQRTNVKAFWNKHLLNNRSIDNFMLGDPNANT